VVPFASAKEKRALFCARKRRIDLQMFEDICSQAWFFETFRSATRVDSVS
jgi:hypothetical protein